MPTIKKGLMKPSDTYFHNVKVLPDLPLVDSIKGVKEKFLEQLGVRRVVALQLIFDRLGEGGAWSHIDGIKYLASVQNNLKPDEIQKLREYPLCPSRTDKKRMVVNQLYEPNSDLEKLELPIISWPSESWRNFSAEARFLYSLGLNRYPSAQTLIQIATKTTTTTEQRNRALDFFTTFYHTYEYNRFDMSKVKEAFLPCEPVDGKVFLCNPVDVYSNPGCKVFGFYILDRRFIADASKLGVKSDPVPYALERGLINKPPATDKEAQEKFGYLAQRVSTFSKTQLAALSRSKIIPVTRKGVTKLVPPYLCFIDTHEEKEKVWEEVFDFVDFGDRANLFLEALGVKDRPDAPQIAAQLAREPKKIYQAMDIGGYLRLLSTLGSNIGSLQRDRSLWAQLKQTPFLLGLVNTTEESGSKTIATLMRADDIVIVDEPRLGVIFREELVVAPERDDCEPLYLALGSPYLSSLVRQKHRFQGSPTFNAATETLRKHIVERAGIFLALPEISPQVQKASYLADNLRVCSYQSMQVERTLVFGRIRASNSENVTAIVDTSNGCLLRVTDPSRVSFNQVAEALNNVVLKKTNRGTDLMFETILKENLEFLRFRGFAVDRLLNRHLEEQRLAKAKQEAEEQERRKEEKARQAQQAQLKLEAERVARQAKNPETVPNGVIANGQASRALERETQKPKIPGAWQDENASVSQPTPSENPPPYSPTPEQPFQNDGRPAGFMNSIRNAFGIPERPQTEIRPPQTTGGSTPSPSMSKAAIDNQLRHAVGAVRPFNQSSLFHPATSSLVQEAPRSYCDNTEAKDLQLFDNAPKWGLETFYATHDRDQFNKIIATREIDVQTFADLLKKLAEVYKVRVDSFHLFYDSQGRTIAFNRSGSIFFNIMYASAMS